MLFNLGLFVEGYIGMICIGIYIIGIKDGKEKIIFIYNNCDYVKCNDEVGV